MCLPVVSDSEARIIIYNIIKPFHLITAKWNKHNTFIHRPWKLSFVVGEISTQCYIPCHSSQDNFLVFFLLLQAW